MDLPNSGVMFNLGYYKVEMVIHTGYGQTKRFVISSEDDLIRGLYPEDLVDRLEIDVTTILRTAVKQCVAMAKAAHER